MMLVVSVRMLVAWSAQAVITIRCKFHTFARHAFVFSLLNAVSYFYDDDDKADEDDDDKKVGFSRLPSPSTQPVGRWSETHRHVVTVLFTSLFGDDHHPPLSRFINHNFHFNSTSSSWIVFIIRCGCVGWSHSLGQMSKDFRWIIPTSFRSKGRVGNLSSPSFSSQWSSFKRNWLRNHLAGQRQRWNPWRRKEKEAG